MVKTFKIVQNLERKYNGENLPIRVRQDDVGTIIESQILTEENNPYDLTGCSVTFNMQPPSGLAVLGEQATITDPKNGKISYSLSAKDTKVAGRPKSACFTISQQNTGILESTGDIDLAILPIPKIADDDYIKVVSDFKDKIRGDLSSNPNFIVRTLFSGYWGYPDVPITEWNFGNVPLLKDDEISQLFYNDYSKTPLFLAPRHDDTYAVVMYCFKCNPNSQKIVINNFNFAPIKTWSYGLADTFPAGRIVFIANGIMNLQKIYNQQNAPVPAGKSRVVEISDTINDAGFKVLKKDTNQLVTDFAIDLTKVNPLTEDGYLILITSTASNGNHEVSDDYFPRNDYNNRYWHSKTDPEPPINSDRPLAPSIQNEMLSPIPLSMTCTQYYLPD